MLEEACSLAEKCYSFPSEKFLVEIKNDNILIAFKGTTTKKEIMADMNIAMIPMGNLGDVHTGFYNLFNERKLEILELLRKHSEKEIITFTGHSLGGALATVSALYFSISLPQRVIKCITFGAPRVGDKRFKQFFERHVSYSIRFINNGDWVPKVPMGKYRHVDEEVIIDTDYFAEKSHSLLKYCPCNKNGTVGKVGKRSSYR